VKPEADVICPVQEDQQAQQLEPGKPIERELAGDQSHSYQLTLDAGMYEKLVVDQRGIDVAVKIFGPDGKQIIDFHYESRERGKETVWLVAEAAGSYQLNILAKRKSALAGRYEIQLLELRAATENDRALHEALKLYRKGLTLYRTGKLDEAISLFERALEIRERILGLDHFYVAADGSALARMYANKGDYAKAEPLYQRALSIYEKALGPNHSNVALSLNNLASLYSRKGEYANAESLYQRALAIYEKALGPDHPMVATSLHNLALLYLGKGNYVKAKPLIQRALSIREKVLGQDHPLVVESLYYLATYYRDSDGYTKAKQFHQHALTIQEDALEPDGFRMAGTLINLANIYNTKGEYAKAEPLLKRALAIYEKELGPDHSSVARTLNILAGVYHRTRREYTKAEVLLKRALAIYEKELGPDHSYIATTLANMANIYRDRGEYVKAEPLYQRALAICEKTLGPQHPSVTRSLNDLAMLHIAKGDIIQAISFQSRTNAAREHNLALNLSAGSERQKLAYLALFSRDTDFTLSLHSQAAPDDPQALDLAFTTLLRRKGRGLDAMTDIIATLRRHATPQALRIFDQLAEARSQLAALTLKESDEVVLEDYHESLRPLEEKIENLEAELSARSAEFRAQSQSVTLAAVQAALPADSALIEFAVHTPQDLQTRKSKPPRYLAYLLPAQGQPRWADLGDAAAIDRAVDDWRQSLRDPNRPDVKQLARTLDDKVMRPVRSLLAKMPLRTRRLLIAPDGSLNLIPFAALVDEQNRYLIERYSISYLTSGGDLLRLQTSLPGKSAPLVVANPDFGRVATIALRGVRDSEKSSEVFFPPLLGTKAEALAVKAVLPKASLLMQQRATETALKQASGPRILHIATHGFFLSDQEMPPAETAGDDPDLRLSKWAAHIKNPLLRSGLALAGANQSRSGDDDGLLTALEAAGLDLWGTKLVVLSACDTGVGEVRNGEGVQGLRRALVLAGSESQMMSLWPVLDRGTKDLMIPYYMALQKGEGRGDGLRQVQLQWLRNKEQRHPFYWAAFILSGEWANLEGRR
jgi:CHAT domain-containing protein/Tfp pilus assembly protein PilF